MKKYLFILLSLTAVYVTSCSKKKDCCVLPQKNEFMIAEKSDKAWEAPVTAAAYGPDTISVYGSNINPGFEESFGFLLKINGKGTYMIKGNQGFYFNTVGRDVSVSGYKLDDSFTNNVTVSQYDESAKIVAGTFQMKFIKTYDNPAGSYPDKIAFLNGKFKVIIKH